jgi:hypothetical protein
MNPSTFRNVNWRPKVKAFRHADGSLRNRQPENQHTGGTTSRILQAMVRTAALSNGKSLMKIRIFLLLSMAMLMVAAGSQATSGTATENKGAAEIKIPGGTRGPILFPHHLHQDKLGDCGICHSVFPQKAGIIEELKEQGKLKKKYVMNKLCIKCHRQKKREGLKAGPTTCAKCHIREKN